MFTLTNIQMLSDASPLLVTLDDQNIELIYIGSHGGEVVCMASETNMISDSEGATGLVWRSRLGLGQHVEASATIYKSMLFVTSHFGIDVDGLNSDSPISLSPESSVSRGTLWAIDSLTGRLLWTVHSAAEVKCSPVVCGKEVSDIM